jgi:hypothetical protein
MTTTTASATTPRPKAIAQRHDDAAGDDGTAPPVWEGPPCPRDRLLARFRRWPLRRRPVGDKTGGKTPLRGDPSLIPVPSEEPGAPEEIRTPDTQIRSLMLKSSKCSRAT